jgi:hypothetical protein
MAEENNGARQSASVTDPASAPASGRITDEDIQILKRKHAFLAEFSDTFIRNTSIGDLMRIESTAMKAKEIERSKDSDDLLASNKANLATTFTEVAAGRDNRWSSLHEGRFLGGAGCSAVKLWLAAKSSWGSSHPPPIGNYDMGALGLAGYVSARGWAEIHNPASTKLSIKLFNINNCARYMIQEFIIIFFPLYIKRNLYLGQVPRRALTRTRRTSWSWESSSWRSGPCAQPCVT